MIESLELMIKDAEYNLEFYKDRMREVAASLDKNMTSRDRELQVQRRHGYSMAVSASSRHINDLSALLSELREKECNCE